MQQLKQILVGFKVLDLLEKHLAAFLALLLLLEELKVLLEVDVGAEGIWCLLNLSLLSNFGFLNGLKIGDLGLLLS